MPLPTEHLLDELATAYIQAVAATAGATISVSRRDYGVDGTLRPIVRDADRYIESGFPVDFQLKGTTVAVVEADIVKFDLKVRNYDLIVTRPPAATPYYLFLVCFGRAVERWAVADAEALTLNASAYWWKMTGAPTGNSVSVRISVAKENRLTFDAVERMLRAAKERYET